MDRRLAEPAAAVALAAALVTSFAPVASGHGAHRVAAAAVPSWSRPSVLVPAAAGRDAIVLDWAFGGPLVLGTQGPHAQLSEFGTDWFGRSLGEASVVDADASLMAWYDPTGGVVRVGRLQTSCSASDFPCGAEVGIESLADSADAIALDTDGGVGVAYATLTAGQFSVRFVRHDHEPWSDPAATVATGSGTVDAVALDVIAHRSVIAYVVVDPVTAQSRALVRTQSTRLQPWTAETLACTDCRAVHVVHDRAGLSRIVFLAAGRTIARTIEADGSLGPVEDLGPASDVDVLGDADAVSTPSSGTRVLMTGPEGVVLREAEPGATTFGTPEVLAAPRAGVGQPRLWWRRGSGLDRAVAVWARSTPRGMRVTGVLDLALPPTERPRLPGLDVPADAVLARVERVARLVIAYTSEERLLARVEEDGAPESHLYELDGVPGDRLVDVTWESSDVDGVRLVQTKRLFWPFDRRRADAIVTRTAAGPGETRLFGPSLRSFRLPLGAGGMNCFSARAVDGLGLVGPWSARRRLTDFASLVDSHEGFEFAAQEGNWCWFTPVDDRRLRRSSGWTKHRSPDAYGHTVLTTRRRGATLTLPGARLDRISIQALVGRGQGFVEVTWKGRHVAGWRLARPSERKLAERGWRVGGSPGPGTLVVRVTSRGKPVTIDFVRPRRPEPHAARG